MSMQAAMVSRYQEKIAKKRQIKPALFVAGAVAGALAIWSAWGDIEKALKLSEQRKAIASSGRSIQSVVPHAELPKLLAEPAAGPLPGSNASVSLTPQTLKLAGIVLGKTVNDGYAMLGVARESTQTYAAGALLANGARLTEIHPKYVVLERAGRSAKLYLDDEVRRTPLDASASALLTIGGESRPRMIVASNSPQITDYVRPTPVFEGGALIGYQVYPGDRAQFFSGLGLQAGDVLTSIDGISLVDAVQSAKMFEALLEGVSHTVVISRNGERQELTLDSSSILKVRESSQESAGASVGSVDSAGI